MVDFPTGVSATDPTFLLGANASAPAKAPVGAAGLAAIAAAAAADLRTAAGLGTMSTENANAVAITGGTAVGLTNLESAAAKLGTATAISSSASVAIGSNGLQTFEIQGTNGSNARAGFTFSNNYGGLHSAYEFGTDIGIIGVADFYCFSYALGNPIFFADAFTGVMYSPYGYITDGDISLNGVIRAIGGPADVDLRLKPKGSGQVVIGSGGWSYNTQPSGAGSILLTNGSDDTPNIKFAYGHHVNFSMDSAGLAGGAFGNVSGQCMRFIVDADEATGALIAVMDRGGNAVYGGKVNAIAGFESLTDAVGIILKSANGDRWNVTVSNAGALVVTGPI